jgi:hypothetical protein
MVRDKDVIIMESRNQVTGYIQNIYKKTPEFLAR